MIELPTRRLVLGALSALAVPPEPARAAETTPGVAITVDDFNLGDTPLMSALDRDLAIRAALRRHGVTAAGFVAGKYVDADRNPRVLAAWSQDGHILGNHSFSHTYYSGRDPIGEMDDILKCEPLLTPDPGFRKLFRFPMLAEGRTVQGRDNLRAMLRACGYRNGHVTIDTSDWYVDQRLTARLKSDPTTDLAPYQTYWLDHIWDRATYYDSLARAVLGRSIDHTILLHHRLTTALFLDDGLEMFRRRGWRLTDAATAFAQPQMKVDYATLPSGQSLMWAAAKASGRFEGQLRYPGEDDKYEKPRMDALGL